MKRQDNKGYAGLAIFGHLIDPDDIDWRSALEQCAHDFYHLPEYARLSAGEGEVPRAFLARWKEHRMLTPFLQRPLPSSLAEGAGLSDVASPYGYPGPIWSRDAPAGFVRDSLFLLRETLKAEGVVCGFFRLHTQLNSPEQFEGLGRLTMRGPSIYVDLSVSEEELWRRTRPRFRSYIRACQKEGFVATIDQSWARLDDFISCYYQSMRRVNARSFYFFGRDYFLRLKEILGDRASLCLTHLKGEVASACIVTEMNGLAQFHLSGTADSQLHSHSSKLMMHFLTLWLKERGASRFHLGGGLGASQDNLYLFKSGFSPLESEFYTWHLVTNESQYEQAVRRWSQRRGAPPVRESVYFPQYRAPDSGVDFPSDNF